ncbi:LexA family protein [Prevotella sp.]|uniref:LexA family protein n=1 Tax=Prevotella sp. TaxID=59823 RepID=UPI003DA47F14
MKRLDASDITQCSSFEACTTRMCEALNSCDDKGVSFIEVAEILLNDGVERKVGALRKFGENQLKTAKQVGLVYDLYNTWFLTCIGKVYNELSEEQRNSIMARIILRSPLYYQIFSAAKQKNINVCTYYRFLSPATIIRRTTSVKKLVEICLNECAKEHVSLHKITFDVDMNPVNEDDDISLLDDPIKARIIDIADAGQRFVTHLPYYPSIKAACHGLDEIEIPFNDVQWINVSNDISHIDNTMFVVKAMGTSMMPMINDGDYCAFSSNVGGSHEGDILLIESYNIHNTDNDDVACTIKKYHRAEHITEDGCKYKYIELIPLNKDFKSFCLNMNDEYRILGIFKKVIRK